MEHSRGRVDIFLGQAVENYMAGGKGKALMRNVYGLKALGMAR